jgi:hypothetical protein
MKKKITYEIKGQIERSCYFRVGKALLRVEFSGGSINSAGMNPAFYVTDNPLYQKAVESSEQFRNGEITIGAVENIDSPAASVCTNAVCADCDDNVAVYADVSNMQQARAVLMGEPYMVPLSELQNKAAVRNKADECGVSFPGWL